MDVGVFVQALWVLHVAAEWIESVPLGAAGIVPAGSVVASVQCAVPGFAAVSQRRQLVEGRSVNAANSVVRCDEHAVGAVGRDGLND